MTLSRAERERIAEIRRAGAQPDDQVLGYLEALRRSCPRGGADRQAIEAAVHGRRGDDGKPLEPFGQAGVDEFDRRKRTGSFGPGAPRVAAEDARPDPDAEARGFWDAFDNHERSKS